MALDPSRATEAARDVSRQTGGAGWRRTDYRVGVPALVGGIVLLFLTPVLIVVGRGAFGWVLLAVISAVAGIALGAFGMLRCGTSGKWMGLP